MRIPNKLNLALFAMFLILGLILLPFGDYATRIGIAAAAFFVGFVLNAVGVIGGGDVKYIAAMLPYIPPGDLGLFCFILAACLLAAVAVHRIARALPPIRRLVPGWKSWTAGKYFPMGFGLSGGLTAYLAVTAFNLRVGIG